MPEGSRRSDAIRKVAWQEAYTNICTIRREGAAETNIIRTVEQNESQNMFGVWLGVRNNSAECFVETAEGVFRAREVRRMEQKDRWDKGAINNVIGVPWRIVDGKWTLDRPMTQIDPLPPPPVPFEGAQVQRERITRTDIKALGTASGCPGCKASRSGMRAQPHSNPCRVRIEERLKKIQKVQGVQIKEARC